MRDITLSNNMIATIMVTIAVVIIATNHTSTSNIITVVAALDFVATCNVLISSSHCFMY